jgi:hypothetical protein
MTQPLTYTPTPGTQRLTHTGKIPAPHSQTKGPHHDR